MSGDDYIVDFSSISRLFRQIGLSLDPAECHGTLCGILCATVSVTGAEWANQVLTDQWGLPAPELASPRGKADGEGRALLLILYKDTTARLDDPEFDFSLLLPDDNHALQHRVDSLSRWCQGFLLGLSLGGVQEQTGLPEESHELMRDFVEISRLGHGAGNGSEEDETAFAEITEYVRMAVLLVYEELRPLRAARPEGAPVH